MTTQRGEEPAAALPGGEVWFAHPEPLAPADDAGPTVAAIRAVARGEGTPGPLTAYGSAAYEGTAPGRHGADRHWSGAGIDDPTWPGTGRVVAGGAVGGGASDGGAIGGGAVGGRPVGGGAVDGGAVGGGGTGVEGADAAGAGAARARWSRRERRLRAAAAVEEAATAGAFDPGDTGTWRVRDVVPGADGGRRNTTILRYLLGLLAVDHVRALTRWTFAVPVVGLVLLLVAPQPLALAVLVLGVLLVIGRIAAIKLIERRSLARRYRPVERELRAAVEAGKANLRGELRRVGMPHSPLAIPRSVVRLGSSDARTRARSRLRDIEIDHVLPRAQLDRALRVLDEATTR